MFICYLGIDVLLNLLIHRGKEMERPQESGIVQAAFQGCELQKESGGFDVMF